MSDPPPTDAPQDPPPPTGTGGFAPPAGTVAGPLREPKKKKKKIVMPGLACDMDYDMKHPPDKDVQFGSIAAKREARPPEPPPAPEKEEETTKKKSLVYPQDPKPKAIQFPFMAPTESAERILHASTENRSGPGNTLGKLKVAHEKLIFPGWLIELSDGTLELLMNVKEQMVPGKKFCEILDPVVKEIEKLALGVKRKDILECLRRVSTPDGGWSFPRFMFAIADPHYGREKGVFTDPVPYEKGQCDKEGGEPDAKKKKQLSREEALMRLYQPYKYSRKQDIWPYKAAEARHEMEEEELGHSHHDTKEHLDMINHVDETGYTQREKVFYSGLLIFEMYHTVKELEELYFQNATIPEPKEKIARNQHIRGFGAENLGTKKKGFAEWDRPLPRLPKKSPYMQDIPFVAVRWKIQKPNPVERAQLRRRTLTLLQPLHLMVHAPPANKEPIKVTENQDRIKKAMEYLASQGNVVAMLPAAHVIIHLSDTFLEKLEEINMRAVEGMPLPEIKPNDDMAMIMRECANIFKLHGIPPQVDRMSHLVNFNTAMCLRKVSAQIRKEHWEFVSERKILFREKAWKYMHVERIPCGALRENFIYAFNTYLPYVSHLPVVYNNTPLPI